MVFWANAMEDGLPIPTPKFEACYIVAECYLYETGGYFICHILVHLKYVTFLQD